MAKRDVHVVPHKDGWATRKEHSERAGGVYDTQREAIDRARAQAQRERSEVVIHRQNGPTVMETIRFRRETRRINWNWLRDRGCGALHDVAAILGCLRGSRFVTGACGGSG